MKAYAAGLLAALMMLVSGALAEGTLRIYVEEGVLERTQENQIAALLGAEFADVQWALMEDGRTLRELVLAGDAPDLAICSPQEARPWAEEGLLLELQAHIGSQQRMQRQVLSQCVREEVLFMAPLIARHRQMAVNAGLMEEMGLGYMLDSQTYPVWYPAQFYQILEEFLIRDMTAMDVWRADMESSAAIEALTQAIFGGMLLGEDTEGCQADSLDMRAGVQWLCDAIDDGMIGYCETREEALERFLAGRTAIYIDWTDTLAASQEEALLDSGIDILAKPYPAAVGLPVRSFELTGVCAFAGGETARDARLRQACARLHESAQEVLGQRGIWQDGALWLPGLEANDAGATLRSLFCTALTEAIEEGAAVDAALARVQAAMDAMERTQ